jgi:hypothetical protein
MMKSAIATLLVLCLASSVSTAQVELSGQTAAHFYKSAATNSPRAVNSGRPSFGWESILFLGASVTENIGAFISVRATEDERIYFDQLAIRLTDLTPLHLNVHVGKFDVPFGNLAERRYPRRNPLFGLPLIYGYRTALPEYVTTESYLVSNRGTGVGMRLLDQGLYDLGAMVSGSVGIVDYAFSVTNGTISTASYGNTNSNSDIGKIIRLAVTPMTGLTLGGAYAWGAYLEESDPGSPHNVNAYVQKAVEFDVAFSRGHFIFYGEGVYNTWPVPLQTRDEKLSVFGYYLEGKYTFLPRLYGALRVGGLRFGDAHLESADQPWDYSVTEWEGGLGYFLDRDVVVKLVRRETRIQGGSKPKDNLTVLQLVVAY